MLFNYSSFIVTFEIRMCKFSDFLFFKIFFGGGIKINCFHWGVVAKRLLENFIWRWFILRLCDYIRLYILMNAWLHILMNMTLYSYEYMTEIFYMGCFILRLYDYIRLYRDFPGGAVVKNPPANAGDTGSSPGLGRSHMPRSN